jgi:uncharacterized membrane protein
MTVLACGVGTWLADLDAAAAVIMNAGLIVLMTTPALRLGTILMDALHRRDMLVIASTLAVIAVLTSSLVIALRR